MIFEIKNLSTEGITAEAFEVLENLARAYREKKHVVWAPRKVCEALAKLEQLGALSKATYLDIKNNAAQLGGFTSMAKMKVCVDFSTEYIGNILRDEGEIVIPYKDLMDSSSFQKTIFLCEDSQDCQLFELIAKYFLNYNKINHRVAFEHFHGGGDRTYREFTNILNNNSLKFCICFVDTDKKHPSGPLGKTAKKFINQEKSPYAQYNILNLHEIELLFPFKALTNVFTDPLTKDQIKTIDYIKKLEIAGRSEIDYLDLKNGFSLTQALQLDREHGSFWNKLLKEIKPKTVKQKCIEDGNCTCGNDCQIIHGLGKTLLPRFLDFLTTKTHQKIRESLTAFKETMWLQLGEQIFWWGCAPFGRRLVV